MNEHRFAILTAKAREAGYELMKDPTGAFYVARRGGWERRFDDLVEVEAWLRAVTGVV